MSFTPARGPQTRFSLEHVPQWLPDDIFDRYLAHFDGIPETTLRRVTAVRLVKLISGKSLGESAHYLGIRTVIDHHGIRVLTSGNVVKRWAENRDEPTEFGKAIEAIANHFRQLDRHVNYRRRRLGLADWSISSDRWNEIIDGIAPNNTNLHSDFNRYFASALVWSTITSGEQRYAPVLMGSEPAGWPHLKSKPRPAWASPDTRTLHQIRLHHSLTALADQLAAHIDTAHPTR
ncbi:ROK family protein [Nocardia amamiensis]|uniref:ROK family protein n=1 Tax=Nocardia amamiensis TaxID=404578 RepID=A0ABS0D2I2_9NOCA|nr:ROK family protein [Nocardia amamiensis]MBF6303055.1 ROK family protein [Nocardia amamiensis]